MSYCINLVCPKIISKKRVFRKKNGVRIFEVLLYSWLHLILLQANNKEAGHSVPSHSLTSVAVNYSLKSIIGFYSTSKIEIEQNRTEQKFY